jgi:hypothetical protein
MQKWYQIGDFIYVDVGRDGQLAGQLILRIDDALGLTDVGTLLASLRSHLAGARSRCT